MQNYRLIDTGQKILALPLERAGFIIRYAAENLADLFLVRLKAFDHLKKGGNGERGRQNRVLHPQLAIFHHLGQLQLLLVAEKCERAHFPKIDVHRIDGGPGFGNLIVFFGISCSPAPVPLPPVAHRTAAAIRGGTVSFFLGNMVGKIYRRCIVISKIFGKIIGHTKRR